MADEDNDETVEAARGEAGDAAGAVASDGVGVRGLGLDRWVQFGFLAIFGFTFWFLGKVVELVWDRFAEPQPVPIAATSFLLAVAITYALYRHERLNKFVHEAASELSKVAWPDRKETWSNTVVVVVASIIAAVILFAFDASWSWVTDLIYKG